MRRSQTTYATRYRLDDLILDVRRRQVTRHGQPLRLTRLTFEMLRVLVEASPAMLTKAELISRVWLDRVVGAETVAQLADAVIQEAEATRKRAAAGALVRVRVPAAELDDSDVGAVGSCQETRGGAHEFAELPCLVAPGPATAHVVCRIRDGL